MRRLFIFRFDCFRVRSVPTRRSISKFRAKLGGMPSPRYIAINRNSIRQKVSPLGGVYLSFGLNWEECRRRDLIFNKNTQNGKEGLPQIWNKYALSKHYYLNSLLIFIVPSYIFSAEWVDFLLSLTLVIFARISSHTPLKFLFMSALEYLNTFIPLSEKYVSLTLSFSAPSGK